METKKKTPCSQVSKSMLQEHFLMCVLKISKSDTNFVLYIYISTPHVLQQYVFCRIQVLPTGVPIRNVT